jgi:murein DD-endopeptidase MepM/ murein hydrolase activator NlpD
LNRKGYEVSEYGNTLIDVANISSGKVLHRAWTMASLTKIKRRIEMITITKKGKFDKSKSFVFIALTMFLTWQTLAATRNFVGLKTLKMSDAEEMVSRMDSKIPIEVNESVLKWLNYFIGDPKGKAYMIKSFERMYGYKTFLWQKLKKKGMPVELLAVPFMESGYDNSRISSARAAGLWQFISSTARRYGLTVNNQVDERYHVDKATDAAISYYNHLLSIDDFDRDWRLVLLAYNTGESRLKKAIKEQGTKNPWAFNHLGDKEYLAKIIAGIILLNNPDQKLMSKPVGSGEVSNKFGTRGRKFHGGVDFKAPLGTPILSPLDGIVKEAKFTPGHGKSVIIDHGNNIITRYSHVHRISVKKGQKIKADEEVATVGTNGTVEDAHLHFEVLVNGKHVNPEIFF